MTQGKAMNTPWTRRGPGSFFFITGGARSGKSRFAQELALDWSDSPVYVATARVWDENFKQRIQHHQQGRDERWTSIEEEKKISRLSLDNKVVIIDCITLWLTNFFVDNKNNIDQSFAECREEIDAWQKMNTEFIIITNEIGMGVHAETEIGRRFTDLQGWTNQYIAQKAASAVMMVSGIPLTLK